MSSKKNNKTPSNGPSNGPSYAESVPVAVAFAELVIAEAVPEPERLVKTSPQPQSRQSRPQPLVPVRREHENRDRDDSREERLALPVRPPPAPREASERIPREDGSKRRICTSFTNRGVCVNGDACIFEHVRGPPAPPTPKRQEDKTSVNEAKKTPQKPTNDNNNENNKKNNFDKNQDVMKGATAVVPSSAPVKKTLCRHFAAGRCERGDSCSFLHEASKQPSKIPATPTRQQDQTRANEANKTPQTNKNEKTNGMNQKINNDKKQDVPNDSVDDTFVVPSPASVKKKPCRHFAAGNCNLGDRCSFLHEASKQSSNAGDRKVKKNDAQGEKSVQFEDCSSTAVPPKTKSCIFFAKGSCKNGNDCPYLHDTPPTPPRERNNENKTSTPKKPPSISQAVVIEMGKKVAEIDAEKRKALTVDLVIVMDCTGSMDPWIAAAKKQVHSIIDRVKENFAESTVNVGFVAYRDYDVPDDRVKSIPLTTDIDRVRAFINEQEPHGGDDYPEDIPGGLQAALAMNWWGGSRCIVLVTDAPCHGRKYHNRARDNYPNGYRPGHPKDPNIENQLREMSTKGIDFMIIDIDPNETQKMIPLLRTAFDTALLPEDGKRRSFSVVPLAKSKVEATEAADILLSEVCKMVNKSITASCSRTEYKLAHLATIYEDEEDFKEENETEKVNGEGKVTSGKPQWSLLDDLPPLNATRHTLWLDLNKLTDWNDLESCIQHVQQNTQIKIMRTPFSEGAMRTAHCLEDAKIGGKQLVAKVFKKKRLQGKIDYHKEAKLQCIARALAKSFSLQSPVGVDFITVSYYETLGLGEDDIRRYFAAEPYLAGVFRKYNNNTGWVSNADSADASSDTTSLVAQAFSHFSWEHTGGKLHVVDLQGVDNILTDPQIHSSGRNFGSGDLGAAGSARFFSSHVCNEYCRALGLKTLKPDAGKARIPAPPAPEEVRVSCELYCGEIMSLPQREYREMLGKGREVYCPSCMKLKGKMAEETCEKCNEKFKYSEFWYQMKGMEKPKVCGNCRKA